MNQLQDDDIEQRNTLSNMIKALTQLLRTTIKSIDLNLIEENLNQIKQIKLESHDNAKINSLVKVRKQEVKLQKLIQNLKGQIEERKICSSVFSSISAILKTIQKSMSTQQNFENQIKLSLNNLRLNLKQLSNNTKFPTKLFNLLQQLNSIIIQLKFCKGLVKVENQDQHKFEQRLQKNMEIFSIKKQKKIRNKNLKSLEIKQHKLDKLIENLEKHNKRQVEMKDNLNEAIVFEQQIESLKLEFQKLDVSSDSSQEFERIEASEQFEMFQQQNPNEIDHHHQQELNQLDDQTNLYESILLIEKFNSKQLQLIKQVEEQKLKELENSYNLMESNTIVEQSQQNQVQKFNQEEKQKWIEEETPTAGENTEKTQNNEYVDEQKNSNDNCKESNILVQKYNQENLQSNKLLQKEDREPSNKQKFNQGIQQIQQIESVIGAKDLDFILNQKGNNRQRPQEWLNKQQDSSTSEQEEQQFEKEKKIKQVENIKHSNTYYKMRKEALEQLKKQKNQEKQEKRQTRRQEKKKLKQLNEQGKQGFQDNEK